MRLQDHEKKTTIQDLMLIFWYDLTKKKFRKFYFNFMILFSFKASPFSFILFIVCRRNVAIQVNVNDIKRV